MTPTDKILAEFDEKFPNLGATDPKEGWYDAKPEVKAFLTSKIHQVVSEEQARVRGLIEKLRKVLLKSDTENINPPTITLDGDYLHFYNQALDDLLASLDKTKE